MAWHLNAIVLWLEPPGGLHRTVSFLIQVWVITATMLLVATLFNASEPNSIGIAGMAACIIFAASYFSGGSILNFIWMMAVSSTVSLGLVWCSVHFAGQIKALVD
ncbi:unnamed protein product [Effrenium voratum]|uniref:Uncharacterized protein n=1 Tax=Effrenium voratum TaxID=2562239 RepID=A0AA36HUJ2_9DINO|nr:unnamed protein product [Effrenium voratum]